MITATATELAPRLVRLFTDAGLIAGEDWESYVKKYNKNKNIVDVLNQDVSLDSFRELLFAEIPMPFRKGKDKRTLGSQLTAVADLRTDELLEMLTIHRPKLEPFINELANTGAVDAQKLKDAVAEAEKKDKDPYEWLFHEGLLDSETLNRFVNSRNNPLLTRCALYLSLSILQHNKIIEEATFDKLLGPVAEKPIAEALDEVEETLGISSPELVEKIEDGLEIPGIALNEVEIGEELLKLFPVGLIRRLIFVPVYQDKSRIGVAMADPLDRKLALLTRWTTGRWLQPYFAPSGSLIDKINEKYGSVKKPAPAPGEALMPSPAPGAPKPKGKGEPVEAVDTEKEPAKEKGGVPAKVKRGVSEKIGRGPGGREVSKPAPRKIVAGEAPVDSLSAVQLVSSLIESAIDLHATDIHLEPTRDSMTVRFRIDGMLTKIVSIPPNLIGPVTSRIKVLANMDVTERRRPQDGHIMLEIAGRHFDFRIATLPTVFGEKVALRILDSARVMTGLEEIGMNKKQLERTHRIVSSPYGVILVTGPTGSGKTSTLYAALNEMNSEDRHLVTIEDPVEYQLNGINQVQVDSNIGLTFSDGLRAILRQDPNVIMVGEIRDPDTCQVAIRAALTGHLVFSTLHTNTAIGAISTLGHLGASPYMIGSAVSGVIAQRLVRLLCEECKKSKPISKALAQQLGINYSNKIRFHRPEGCPECLNMGYSGRTGIFEVLEVTDRLRRAILDDKSPSELLDIANEEGRVSIREAGLEIMKQGLTSPEEVIQKVILDS